MSHNHNHNIVVDYFQREKDVGATLGRGGLDDGGGGVGAEQEADHLLHHPAGDCGRHRRRCQLQSILDKISHPGHENADQVEMKCTIQYASDYPVIWMKLDSVDR